MNYAGDPQRPCVKTGLYMANVGELIWGLSWHHGADGCRLAPCGYSLSSSSTGERTLYTVLDTDEELLYCTTIQ